MAKYIKIVFFIFIFCVVLAGAQKCKASSSAVPAPTITEAKGNQIGKPFITGLMRQNSEVLVYINGVFAQIAKSNKTGTTTNNFYYNHNEYLEEGNYEIALVARDQISLLLSPSVIINFVVLSLPAPTLIAPNETASIGKLKPVIIGLTANGTFARIYIDGVYNGKTEITKDQSGTANFVYKPFLNLSKGWHTVQAEAEIESGRKSAKSLALKFKIEDSMPAPTLIATLAGADNRWPVITGLAKNNSLINLYIDHRLFGKFALQNHLSGTGNFAFKTPLSLANSSHLVYATAINAKGKESIWSNILYFSTPLARKAKITKQPAIASAEKEEIKEKASVIAELKLDDQVAAADKQNKIKEERPINEAAITEAKSKESEIDKEIEKILSENVNKESGGTGLINEDKEKQSKLKLNAIIFVIFLLAVIGWIIWVNRELYNEKEQTDNKDNEIDENKFL